MLIYSHKKILMAGGNQGEKQNLKTRILWTFEKSKND